MDYGIRERVAFISGGSKVLCLSVAYMLVDEGCKVAVVARSHGPIDVAVAVLRLRGCQAVGLLKTLSDEVARRGITVNSVGPGWIGTDHMFADLKQKMAIKPGDVKLFLGGAAPAARTGATRWPR